MIKKIAFFSCVAPLVLWGQTVSIQSPKVADNQLLVSYYHSDELVPFDTLTVDAQGKCQFKFPTKQQRGAWFIRPLADEKKSITFLYDVTPFTLVIPESFDGMQVSFTGSVENSKYLTYRKLKKEWSTNQMLLTEVLRLLPADDPILPVIEKEHAARFARLENFVNTLQKEQPNALVTKIARNDWESVQIDWKQPANVFYEQKANQYFTHFNINDSSLLYVPVLLERVMDYFNLYVNPQANYEQLVGGYIAAADQIFPKISSPAVKSAVIDFVLEGMEQVNMEPVITHIYNKYVKESSCTETPVMERAKKRVKQGDILKQGNLAPDISGTTMDGKTVNLHSIPARRTVVVFWASWCPHCMQELPMLNRLYTDLQKSFAIFTVSLDTEKAEWEKAAATFDPSWVQVCDFKKWDSKPVEDYAVYGTPFMVVLDENKRVIGRPYSLEEVYQMLQ